MTVFNNSPVLSLSEIISRLFDNKFLSDCVFIFENDTRIINAHSLLLRARSIVFDKLFKSYHDDDSNVITILKYSYDEFLQFIRFFYFDKCNVTIENVTNVLELAVKYRVPKLENIVCEFITENELVPNQLLQIYQFCVSESYQLLYGWVEDEIVSQLPVFITSDYFLELEPNTLEFILHSNYVGTSANPVREIHIFKGLLRWMVNYSTKNNVTLDECRVKFHRLIKAIRFPTMVISELNAVIHEYDNLLTHLDLLSFFTSTNNQLWNSNNRNVYSCETNDAINTSKGMPSDPNEIMPFNSVFSYQLPNNRKIYFGFPFQSENKVVPTRISAEPFHVPQQDVSFVGIDINQNIAADTVQSINQNVTTNLFGSSFGMPINQNVSTGGLFQNRFQPVSSNSTTKGGFRNTNPKEFSFPMNPNNSKNIFEKPIQSINHNETSNIFKDVFRPSNQTDSSVTFGQPAQSINLTTFSKPFQSTVQPPNNPTVTSSIFGNPAQTVHHHTTSRNSSQPTNQTGQTSTFGNCFQPINQNYYPFRNFFQPVDQNILRPFLNHIQPIQQKNSTSPFLIKQLQLEQSITAFTPDKDLLITGLWIKASSTKTTTITVICDEEEIVILHLNVRLYESILSLGESILLHADKLCKIIIDGELGVPKSMVKKPRDVIDEHLVKTMRDVKLGEKLAKIFVQIPLNT